MPSEGKRDPTNFRRVILRHRGGTTHFYALLSRVRAPHVQYWSPQLSRNGHPDTNSKSIADSIIPDYNFNHQSPAYINTFVIERRAQPPGENVVVEVETMELKPVGCGALFDDCMTGASRITYG